MEIGEEEGKEETNLYWEKEPQLHPLCALTIGWDSIHDNGVGWGVVVVVVAGYYVRETIRDNNRGSLSGGSGH
jgi:hypothetical protein